MPEILFITQPDQFTYGGLIFAVVDSKSESCFTEICYRALSS